MDKARALMLSCAGSAEEGWTIMMSRRVAIVVQSAAGVLGAVAPA
jgi:hypothetical protein